MCKSLLILLLVCSSALAQVRVEVESFSAITAKSVRTEPLADRVAVFLTEPDTTQRTGAFLKITSGAKWATPFLDSVEFAKTNVPGHWMMFAKPGTYRVTIIEFDPESGPMFTGVEVVVSGSSVVPDDPIDPPKADFKSLIKFVDDAADKLADPELRKVLASAYKSAVETIVAKNLSYDEAVKTVTMARFSALSAVPMTKDWNGVLLKPLMTELAKLVRAGDVQAYAQAITAIQKGLEE